MEWHRMVGNVRNGFQMFMAALAVAIATTPMLALATPALAQSEAAPAQTGNAASTAVQSAPADFSGLWAISNNSVRGALDADLKPITGNLLTPEGEKRKAEWRRLQEIYAEELPVLPLYFRADSYIVPKWLTGIEPTGHQIPSTMWIERWRPRS